MGVTCLGGHYIRCIHILLFHTDSLFGRAKVVPRRVHASCPGALRVGNPALGLHSISLCAIIARIFCSYALRYVHHVHLVIDGIRGESPPAHR